MGDWRGRSGARGTRFKSGFSHLLGCVTVGEYLASLSFCFLTCVPGVRMAGLLSLVRSPRENVYKAVGCMVGPLPGTLRLLRAFPGGSCLPCLGLTPAPLCSGCR